jgi:transcriptional regulator with XRE-family HTH domain
MRRSPERHNLARLRLFLGLGQKEMAEKVGCSTHTIQSVELGRLPLSQLLALKISNATGVEVGWLLENDLSAPLTSDRFKPFTIEHYYQRRTDRELGLIHEQRLTALSRGILAPPIELMTIAFYAWMRAIFATNDGNIALWQTRTFLEKLAKKYGHNRRIISTPGLGAEAVRDFRVLREHADAGAKFVTEKYKDVLESEGSLKVHGRLVLLLKRGKKRILKLENLDRKQIRKFLKKPKQQQRAAARALASLSYRQRLALDRDGQIYLAGTANLAPRRKR